ncbi:MAG: hypothetical protein HQ583_07860 [Candidatus Abyssubacteria bacterium]|nr:hypothetical protein [Candidatus Abyssubacteria bacterium]
MTKVFYPEKVFVEQTAAQLPRTKRILDRVGEAEIISVADHRKIDFSGGPHSDRFARAKKHLAVTVKKGGLVKEFRRHSCLRQGREYYLVHAAGCPFDCSYCYLQSYFENPVPTIFVNTDELFEQVESALESESDGEVLFHAGETADALALEHLSGFAAEAVEFFSKLPGALLELRTKSAGVETILPLSHAGRTVVAWTLTPRAVAERYERGAALLEARLEATARCARAGYPVGLRLDPLIHYDGWREGYRGLMEEISAALDAASIHSIVLGAFRFPPPLREIILERHGRNELALGEFIPSPDGKMRYFRHIREEMYRELVGLIRESFGEGCVNRIELAMEPEFIWESVGLSGPTRRQPV